MATWNIRQWVEYHAEDIEADSFEEAYEIYLKNQQAYYVGVNDEEIEEVDEDEEL